MHPCGCGTGVPGENNLRNLDDFIPESAWGVEGDFPRRGAKKRTRGGTFTTLSTQPNKTHENHEPNQRCLIEQPILLREINEPGTGAGVAFRVRTDRGTLCQQRNRPGPDMADRG